jgi:exosome complex component CSL4
MQILTVGDQPLEQPFQGIVRVQDIRAMQIDTASVYASFRPGDIVRAQVLSLGTARSFYLTTARNDLGVVLAQDGQLTPISWCEVMDPKTGTREPRKVAKP